MISIALMWSGYDMDLFQRHFGNVMAQEMSESTGVATEIPLAIYCLEKAFEAIVEEQQSGSGEEEEEEVR